MHPFFIGNSFAHKAFDFPQIKYKHCFTNKIYH